MEPLRILGPMGDDQFRFGGDTAYSQRQVKDYIVSLEWYGPTGKAVDACVVIWSARAGIDSGAWVIGRKRIAAYVDSNMRPTPYGLLEANAALPILGRIESKHELHALMDVLLGAVDDLVHMPAVPLWARRRASTDAFWEVEHKDINGKTLHEAAV